MNNEKEVYFDQYCKSCKHRGLKESKDPCNDCLAESSNTNSHKPMNYEVLANIYKSRRHHKLDEWHTFCDWIETLSYSELITGKEKKADV